MNSSSPPDRDIPSPCVRNCCLDANDICLGCFRTLAEITGWGAAGEDEKRAILARCRERAAGRQAQSRRPPSPDAQP
ncbi:MAG: DUF1289 domain-containing protein [Gammaproteobacteria bacterium]|jgi:predicted Fe-S protein YdhL (DUF1289 family)|nr:DUF1289 domain-containing protein [Gammaproteobacteria bacterium]